MSYNASVTALRLELRPSRLRRNWRWATHIAAASTVPMLQSPGLIAAVVVALLLSLYCSRSGPAITLLWDSAGRWTLYRDDSETDATLDGSAFIQPWLVILPLRRADTGRMHRLAIFPDMLSAQDFRRLRVRLRRATGADAGDLH